MRVLGTVGITLILITAWAAIAIFLAIALGNGADLWSALIAVLVVFSGYWLISTGRLARMFRRVD